MNEKQKQEIIKHGEDLKGFFNLNKEIDPLKLCKSLKRLENKAHKLMEHRCNGIVIKTEEEQEVEDTIILNKVDKILNFKKQNIKVFLNGDPRGYALKIDLNLNNIKAIHRDMGDMV